MAFTVSPKGSKVRSPSKTLICIERERDWVSSRDDSLSLCFNAYSRAINTASPELSLGGEGSYESSDVCCTDSLGC